MKNLFRSLLLVLALAPGITAQADTITGAVGPAQATANLNNFRAFAFYGVNGATDYTTITGTATTDATNAATFSTLTAIGSGATFASAGVGVTNGAVTYTGAVSPQGTTLQNAANGTIQFAYVNNCANGKGFSLTTKLIATTESITFYLHNFNTTSNFSASVGAATWTLNQQVLPSPGANLPDGTGKGNTDGIVHLTVTGTIGETLTFSDLANYTGVSTSTGGNVGISSATVSAAALPVTVDTAAMTWTLPSTTGRSDWINVKSAPYNATGNGTTDDTAAIQSALDAVKNGTVHASTIYFPAGTYIISSTLTWETYSYGGGWQLVGCGKNTIIKWKSTAPVGGAMFRTSNLCAMRYIGLTWDGNGTSAGTTGASCAYQDNTNNSYESEIRHENESFKNFWAPGTYPYYDAIGTTHTVTTPAPPASGIITNFPGGLTGEMRIYNCKFTNCANGAYCAWAIFNFYMWHIDSCEFDNCGVGFNAGGHGGCFAISNNHFQGSTVSDIYGASYIHVRHCTSTGSQEFIRQAGGATILQDCWVDGWKNTGGAVELVSSASYTVTDCSFTNPPAGGLGPLQAYLGSGINNNLLLSNNYAPDFPAGYGILNNAGNLTNAIQIVPPGLRFSTITSPSQTFIKTTWPADSANIINVTNPIYAGGADPTFTNPSDAAINAALSAAATANNGTIVYFPFGQYKITAPLTAPTGKYSLEGVTSSSQLVWWGTSPNTMLNIATPQSMAVHGFQFLIISNPTGADTSAPTCDSKAITCIKQTSTGTSSITYDYLSCWEDHPNGANLGPSNSLSNNPGLQLSSLPTGSTVNIGEIQMPLTVQSSSAAQVFVRLGGGVIGVSGTSAKTGFMGALVSEGGQQADPTAYNIVVNDNQDLVVADYYSEQCRNDLNLLRGAGTGTGRVTIQGYVSSAGTNNPNDPNNGPTVSVNVNNYAGRLFYGPQGFGNNGGNSPVQITQVGANAIDMIFEQNGYSDGLTLSTTGTANLIQTQDSAPAVQPPLTSANLISMSLGFDHLRQLEAVDLSLNHSLATDAPPVAAYPMENNVLDTTTTYNGTNHGATFVGGVVGVYAAQFDGVSNYISIPRSVTTNFSIAMWIQTTDTGASGSWNAGKGLVDADATGTALDFGTSLNAGRFSLGVGTPDTTLTSTVPVNDGNWHHLIATRNSTTGAMQVYVDGVLNNAVTGPTGTRSAATTFRVGSIQTGVAAGFFKGILDQVHIYNYVISANDAAALYRRTKPDAVQMLAHWTMDEQTGTTSIDATGHGFNGAWQNSPSFSYDRPSSATFDQGSLLLNGTNQFVNIPIVAGLPTGRAPRTLCGWAKAANTTGSYRQIAAFGSANTSQAMFIGMNGTSLVGGGYGGDDLVVPSFWDTNWHFIALTYDGTTAKLYADGVLVSSAAKTWNLVAGPCYLGEQVNGAPEFWNGNIDEIRIYNSALTAAQIASLAAGNP